MAILGVSKPVALRDLSDPDDIQCSSSNLIYKKVLWARMPKYVLKYWALLSKSSVAKIVTTDTHTHRHTQKQKAIMVFHITSQNALYGKSPSEHEHYFCWKWQNYRSLALPTSGKTLLWIYPELSWKTLLYGYPGPSGKTLLWIYPGLSGKTLLNGWYE